MSKFLVTDGHSRVDIIEVGSVDEAIALFEDEFELAGDVYLVDMMHVDRYGQGWVLLDE